MQPARQVSRRTVGGKIAGEHGRAAVVEIDLEVANKGRGDVHRYIDIVDGSDVGLCQPRSADPDTLRADGTIGVADVALVAEVANDPDVTGDGVVNIFDISLVSSCLGEDIILNAACTNADVDGDGGAPVCGPCAANGAEKLERETITSASRLSTSSRLPNEFASNPATTSR